MLRRKEKTAVIDEKLCIPAKDIDSMRHGLQLMLTNKFGEADEFYDKILADLNQRSWVKGQHNPTGAFMFIGSLTGMIHGLATLESDQLAKAIEGMQKADEAADKDAEWAGKVVVKGLCMLLQGVMRLAQGEKKKGIWQVCRSWAWLRHLEKQALNYEGPESPLVRSATLLSLGLFNLVLSFLPPTALRAACWISGLEGRKETALKFLQTCVEEDGVLSPFGVVFLTIYQLHLRDIIGEKWTEADLAETDRQLALAEARYPSSIWFQTLRSDYCGCRHQPERAFEVTESMRPAAAILPALGMLIHARRATLSQAQLQWSQAAQSIREALTVFRKVNRRSFVPAMAATAALLHEVAGERDQRDEMMLLVREYQKIENKKWDFPDVYAFGLRQRFKNGDWEPELELYYLMSFSSKATRYMDPENVKVLLERLAELEKTYVDQPERLVFCLRTQATLQSQIKNYEAALESCNKGLQVVTAKDSEAQKQGCPQFMLYLKAAAHFQLGALAEAKEALRKLDQADKNCFAYFSVLLKKTTLGKLLGLEIKDTFMELNVSGRNVVQYAAKVPADLGEVEWEFSLEDYTINFTASWIPAGGSPSSAKVLQTINQFEASSGPSSGRFESKGEGTLMLTFDNKFSLVRGKKLICRVMPDTLTLTKY